MADDPTLETLLLLDGERFFLGGAGEFIVEFSARRVPPTTERPHGVDYSLVLIGPDGERLVGYDNAHRVRAGRGPGAKRPAAHDHRHRGSRVRPYDYDDAGKLLEDFWSDVEAVLEEKGVTP
jgi:YD repeat-containing protein